MRSPLAMCDARSIAEADLIPTALANYGAGQAKSAAERIDEGIGQFDIFQASASPAHKWYYYPKMDRDEVLVFKTFDSKIPVRSALAHWQFIPRVRFCDRTSAVIVAMQTELRRHCS